MKHSPMIAASLCVFAAALPAAAEPTADVPIGAEGAPKPPMAFSADVRGSMLVRSNTEYFHHAETFGYPIPSTGGGVALNVGVELVPRISLFAMGGYYGQGATREGYGKLMLTSEALLFGVRYAILRTQATSGPEKIFMAQLEGWAAGGKYWIRDTYVDPLLSATTYVRDGTSAGFAGGLDASIAVSAVRFIVGYAYHYAPASVSNEIGGVARAGGHEVSLGVGVRL